MNALQQAEAEAKIDKLPQWAQQYIAAIRREREAAVRALNEHCDQQTPAAFFCKRHECTGETSGPSTKIQYIQTHRVCCIHHGIELFVSVEIDRRPGIGLQWFGAEQSLRDIAFVPESYCAGRLLLPEHMRK